MSTTDRLDRVLAQLEGAMPSADQHKAHCPGPSHRRGDRNRSLTVTPMADGGIRLKCFTGCTHEQIVTAAGIDRADLRSDGTQSLAPARGFKPRATPAPKQPKPPPPGRVKRLGEASWPVRDTAGVLIATKRREDWRLADGSIDKARWWEPTLKSLGVAVEDVPLYGSHQLMSLPAGATVVVVEGEKAAQALLDAGVAAVGTVTGAAKTPSPAVLSALAGYDTVLWPDNDEAGQTHMTAIAGALADLAIPCRWFAWRRAPEKGDAADWLDQHAGDGCALPMLRAVLDNAPTWAPPVAPVPVADAEDSALLFAITRLVRADIDMTAAERQATIDAEIQLHELARRGQVSADGFYLPDAGGEGRAHITCDTVAKARAKWTQYAGVSSHLAPPPPELVAAGLVKAYDANHLVVPAERTRPGSRLIEPLLATIPAKPPHKAKGVPRPVLLREVLPETIELCDVCPPETPLSIQIICTGCGQLCYDQTHVCCETGQTVPKFSALLRIDRDSLSSQKTMPKFSARFEPAHRVARRRHALATLEPAIPPREGLLIPETVAPSGPIGPSVPLEAPAPTCAICGTSPAPHRTGHRPPLQVCRSCLLAPIPMDDTGRALIAGTATYSGSSLAAGGND